jgi:hypothetical protein
MPIPSTTITIKGIAAVLKDEALDVPVYQRSFEWTEQVSDFLEDVGGSFERKREPYFLGSMVIIAPEGHKRGKVLDGQQRLAVASILLACIADNFDSLGKKDPSDSIRTKYLTSFDFAQATQRPQLKLNQADDAYFRSILTKMAGAPGSGAPESHRRLWQARATILSWLSAKLAKAEDRAKWLGEFTDYLDQLAYVIYFTVSDDANAFLIFETMNDRGLDLSIADLLKNYLIGLAKEDYQTILDCWIKSIACLSTYGGEELFTTFLRHFWSSKYGLVREKDLYRSIKSRVSTRETALELAKELLDNAYYYAAILSDQHEYWSEGSVKAREYIRTLRALGLEQYRPMLLSALAHFKADQVESILNYLISWSARLLIVGGLGGGVIETNYCQLAEAIRKGDLKNVKEVAEKGRRSFVPNDTVFESSFSTVRVSKAHLARYYLHALEIEKRGKDSDMVPASDLTLEHILPERPAAGTWPNFSEEDKEDYVKRLGNMVLLTGKLNSKLRNAPFSEKRKRYKDYDLILTREVSELENWSKTTIDKRQKELAKLAVKAWRI